MAGLLKEALQLTANLDGTYNFTGAVDRLRGTKKSTTDAADEIKRLLKIDPTAIEEMLEGGSLAEALSWAMSTRPTKNRRGRRAPIGEA
jgi:hypothetical protein